MTREGDQIMRLQRAQRKEKRDRKAVPPEIYRQRASVADEVFQKKQEERS